MWSKIKSSTRVIIVVQCSYGMSFVRKELYNGLNTPNSIKKIFINPPTKQVEVDSGKGVTGKEVKSLIEHVRKAKHVPREGVPSKDGAPPIEENQFIIDVVKVLEEKEAMKNDGTNFDY